jgi:hypothetical protein
MTAMRLKRYPSPSGGIALGKMGVGATMLKQGKTARDYVQDGLVAMWDGIENAGWGVHNQFAPKWKNLGAGGSNWDLSISGDSAWQDTMFDSSNALASTSSRLSMWTKHTLPLTIECTAMGIGYQQDQYNKNKSIFTIYAREMDVYCTLYQGEAMIKPSKRWNQGVKITTGPTVKHHICIVANPTSTTGALGNGFTADIYIDGVLVPLEQSSSYPGMADSTAGGVCIGGYREYHNGAKIFRSAYYSRALTADEIAANHAIDKERFNLL